MSSVFCTTFTAPISSAASDRPSRWGMMACLQGMVTLEPSQPSMRRMAASTSGRSSGSISNATYTAFTPHFLKDSVWVAGDME